MPRSAGILVWPLLALLAVPGCGHFHKAPEPPAEVDEAHAIVQRTRIDPASSVTAPSLAGKLEERTYWGSTPHETQCRAAAKSGTADMMEKEYESLENQHCLARNSKSTRMKKTMLRHASVEARNVAAGTALELYYRLAELEAKADLIRDGLGLVGASLAEMQKAKEQGLKAPPEHEKLLKQQLELAADLTRAQLGIQQANGELGRLLNWHELGLNGYLWPIASFNLVETQDDPEAAVQVGMVHRAQLTLIRAVRDDVDAKSLPAMLLLLRSYNGFLGMSRAESFVSFMGAGLTPGKHKEADKRRQQMDEMLREQEYVVAQEIRLAIHTIRAKANLVAVARKKAESAEEKLKDLEDKNNRGIASVVEVSAQRLQLVQARAEVIQEIMAWHTAQAKLKQAQGVLALECGYTPEHPWNNHDKDCTESVSSSTIPDAADFSEGTVIPSAPANEARSED